MIDYSKHWMSVPLIFHGFYGSPGARAIWMPMLSTLLCWLLRANPDLLPVASGRPGIANGQDYIDARGKRNILHEYPIQILLWMIGFMMVYRTNASYSRWWEARRTIQRMASKWLDVFLFCSAWDAAGNNTGGEDTAGELFRGRLAHLVSLCHALAMQSLRGDRSVDNLIKHKTGEKDPNHSAYCSGAYPAYNRWSSLRGNYQVFDLSTRHLVKYHASAPIPVVDGVTEGEKRALENVALEMAKTLHRFKGEQLRQVFGETADKLFEAGLIESMCNSSGNNVDERVAMVMSEIHWIIVKRRLDGGINVSGPELSRMWQCLTDGHIGYMQARKIRDTPFPFPHAQMIMMGLVMFAFFCPVVCVAYLDSAWLAYSLNFISVWSYYSVNEVCRELEDPFTYDPNDLPLSQLSHDFNERMFAVLHALRSNAYHCNSMEVISVMCTTREGIRCTEPPDQMAGQGPTSSTVSSRKPGAPNTMDV